MRLLALPMNGALSIHQEPKLSRGDIILVIVS